MKKCMWCTTEGFCEIKDGVADDDSCNGTKEDIYGCYIAQNNAEYDGEEMDDLVNRWYGGEHS